MELSPIHRQALEEMTEYVDSFIANRFDQTLDSNPQVKGIIVECVLDAFHDGARWAEAKIKEESPIIT